MVSPGQLDHGTLHAVAAPLPCRRSRAECLWSADHEIAGAGAFQRGKFAVDYLHYLMAMATDWRVLSAAGATFLAGVCWLLALQHLKLGYAYPFMALSFVLI